MRAKPITFLTGLLLVVLLVAGGLLVLRKPDLGGGDGNAPAGRVQTNGLSVVKNPVTNAGPSQVSAAAGRGTNSAVKVKKPGVVNAGPLTADQQAAEKMRARLDEEDGAGALALARQLAQSSDAEVRAETVAVLGWIGVKALPELSRMLSDKDETVAKDAYLQWKNAVDEVQDEALQAQLLQQGMAALTDQGDLELCVMEFDSLPFDIAVRSLVSIIQGSNVVASEVAREHYEFLTSGPYTSPADAEKTILANAEPAAK